MEPGGKVQVCGRHQDLNAPPGCTLLLSPPLHLQSPAGYETVDDAVSDD